jgi:AraC family transcriptional regulator
MWQDITKSSPTNGMPSTHLAEGARALASRARHAVCRSSPTDSVHDGQTDRGLPHRPYGYATADVAHPAVEISPPDTGRRRFIAGHGMAAESVQCASQGVVKYRFRAPIHLLVAYEQSERRDGETFVEGLPRSTLRNFARKLTFVPAGHEYHAWHAPRTKAHLIYFYFDPAKLNIHPKLGIADISIAPRLFFEDATLWHTVLKLKLKSLVETPTSDDCLSFDSLGIVLVHELARLNRGKPSIEPQVRGGLAAWQQRNVTAYIEEHLAERIPLITLARLVHLSLYHFCRSSKRSFGMPPHQYQIKRRIDRALLAKRAVSVTDIALSVDFSSSNSFATTFRKVTGCTPTAYHRS